MVYLAGCTHMYGPVHVNVRIALSHSPLLRNCRECRQRCARKIYRNAPIPAKTLIHSPFLPHMRITCELLKTTILPGNQSNPTKPPYHSGVSLFEACTHYKAVMQNLTWPKLSARLGINMDDRPCHPSSSFTLAAATRCLRNLTLGNSGHIIWSSYSRTYPHF
jgi:hypothetical protein